MHYWFEKSTDFGQSQWPIEDLRAQRGGVNSDPQKGGKEHLHLIKDCQP